MKELNGILLCCIMLTLFLECYRGNDDRSLNLYQSLSLYYLCLAGKLPDGTEELCVCTLGGRFRTFQFFKLYSHVSIILYCVIQPSVRNFV